MEERKKRLAYNTFSSLFFQVATVVCGFILPRLILSSYGSDVNGLVNSISQFLGVISFLELGVGAVVQSSLYKPLAENDEVQISRIIKSANRFFRTIAAVLLCYVIILVTFYPRFTKQTFDYAYTATLIVAMSLSSFAQYYFGIVNRILLTADQRGYIQCNAQTAAVVLNTLSCFILIRSGASIQVVKLATSLIFLLQPFSIYLYVRRHYCINHRISYTTEPINQKWNGIAQHVAAVVLEGTDIVILTLFDSLVSVSIYSVYYLVVNGVKQLFQSLTHGVQSLMGDLWARGEKKELRELFGWTEWLIHTGTVFLFGVTAIAIVPFVKVYTLGVNDADYSQPLFAVLLVAAHAGHCLRLPYNILILAVGHYRETQSNYIIAAVMNVVISVMTVSRFGLIGVAVGTLAAMCYQTIWMAVYDSRHLIDWPIKKFFRQLAVDILTVAVMVLATWNIEMQNVSYWAWILYAFIVSMISIGIIVIMNMIFYRERMKKAWASLIARRK